MVPSIDTLYPETSYPPLYVLFSNVTVNVVLSPTTDRIFGGPGAINGFPDTEILGSEILISGAKETVFI